jgi:hypothetical protein
MWAKGKAQGVSSSDGRAIRFDLTSERQSGGKWRKKETAHYFSGRAGGDRVAPVSLKVLKQAKNKNNKK